MNYRRVLGMRGDPSDVTRPTTPLKAVPGLYSLSAIFGSFTIVGAAVAGPVVFAPGAVQRLPDRQSVTVAWKPRPHHTAAQLVRKTPAAVRSTTLCVVRSVTIIARVGSGRKGSGVVRFLFSHGRF